MTLSQNKRKKRIYRLKEKGKEMELNRMIDHTILKADASKEAVMQIIEEAKNIILLCLHQSSMGCASKRTITRRTSSRMYSDRVSFRSKHIRDKSI